MVNFTEDDVVFAWFDMGSRNTICLGPLYTNHVEMIGGKNYYHTKEQLLQITSLSKTIKNKIESAKEGTSFIVHYLHATGDLYLKRLSKEEIKIIIERENLLNQLTENKKAIVEATLELQKTQKKLMSNLRKKHHTLQEMGLK